MIMFWMCCLVVLGMQVWGRGCIFNMLSDVVFLGDLWFVDYVIVKMGIVGLIWVFLIEFVYYGIIVNIICFGVIVIEVYQCIL